MDGKNCMKSHLQGKMQIKAKMRYHSASTGMATMKKPQKILKTASYFTGWKASRALPHIWIYKVVQLLWKSAPYEQQSYS
jgi:hypothetical protein